MDCLDSMFDQLKDDHSCMGLLKKLNLAEEHNARLSLGSNGKDFAGNDDGDFSDTIYRPY